MRGRRPVHLDALVVGLLGAATALAFAWVPSLWFDEAATVVAATRPWPDLVRMITTVDLVHATYYAFMHVWFDIFSYTPLTLRLPSVLATGVAAGLTVTLGRVLVGRRAGVIAGLLFVMLPRVTWMGLEGRSYALTTALGVAATLVFLLAWRRTTAGRPSWGWWVAYTVLAIVSSAMFLYVALLIVGHGVTAVLALVRSRRGGEDVSRVLRAFVRWVVAAAIVALAVAPLAVMVSAQSTQVSWIKRPTLDTIHSVLVTQWFPENSAFAIYAGVLVLASIAVVASRRTREQTNTLFVVVPIALVPTIGLIAISLVRTPLYSPRYVTMGTPDIALLMALGLAAVPWRRVIAAVLVVATLVAGALLSAPTFIDQRQPTAKDGAAWDQVSALIAAERATEPAGTVDSIIWGPVRRHPAATSRIIENSYGAAFVGMRDLSLQTPAAKTDGLWDVVRPAADALTGAADSDTVWLVTSDRQDQRPVVTAGLEAQGFHLAEEWHLSRTNVVRYER